MSYPRKLIPLQHHRVYVLLPSSLISLLDRNKATGTFRKAMSSFLGGSVSHRWPPVNRLLFIRKSAGSDFSGTHLVDQAGPKHIELCLSVS